MTITPDWTLNRLKEEFPGVELVLFSHFGIGSRERSGFHGEESLTELLRRHLVFDAEKACERLSLLAEEDHRFGVEPEDFARMRGEPGTIVVDARSEEEHRFCALADSQLLSGPLVEALKSGKGERAVCVCGDGSQSPSASRVLRGLGIEALHLQGGLRRWSEQVDQTFPVLYPLDEKPGCWYILADGKTLRFRRPVSLECYDFGLLTPGELKQFSPGRELLHLLPDLQCVISTPHTFGIRLSRDVSAELVEILAPFDFAAPCWQEHLVEGNEDEERQTLETVLALEAPKILASHKGTVSIDEYRNRVLTLSLGGGCAGCASAQITTKRELAAPLLEAVPLLDRIRSAFH